ncbi:MAG: hypothetical protein QOG85_2227, partial [Gaiellaceae bacterium]|nr:hypothetical protein [Gaiellaceae bacterium]
MAANTELVLRVRVTDQGVQVLEQIAGKAKAAESSFGSLKNAAVTLNQGFQLLQSGASIISSITSSFSEQADKATTLSARLRLVSTSSTEYNTAQSRLFEISQQTGTSLESNVNLYTRLARNTAALGVSQNDLLRVTETLNKALIVSGATSEEASAGTLQLTQAFAKGRLDGDEFRSVMENMPPVADALARSLGVTKGELFALAKEGQLSGAALMKALLEVSDKTDAAFSKLPETIGRAWQGLQNQILVSVGRFDQATGTSTA